MSKENYDVVIIGGGAIGCSTARALSIKYPTLKVCIIEKESELANHQSGRNSGVVHVGYNQKPGTLKAKFVVEGSRRLRQFCKERGVSLTEGGILVVARRQEEIETLQELFSRGEANGAKVSLISRQEILAIEPYASGVGALFAPEGASFDAKSFVIKMAEEAKESGVAISLSEKVRQLNEEGTSIEIETNQRFLRAKIVINAAGLYADTLAHTLGVGRNYQIIPFKGQYYELTSEKRDLVKSHIYPPANLKFPFLGIHFSRTFEGHVKVGPSANLVFGRESYEGIGFCVADFVKMTGFSGFWKMFASKDFRFLVKKEWKKSFFKNGVLEEARQLVPDLKSTDLVIGTCGIRAQLVTKDGQLMDDLVIEETPRSIHILNAVSPALTCSLPFADHIASLVENKL